jgi:hypothetical protein
MVGAGRSSLKAMSAPVTLEILVCPADLGYAADTIRHQLRVFAAQVDEVLFAVDVKPPKGGRYADGWGDALPALDALLDELMAEHPNARVVRAAGEPAALAHLGERFFGGATIPSKDCRGSAFEVYFTAFDGARNDLILHTDSDMLFGGGSPTWVAEAVELLQADTSVISVIPLSGPPRADGQLLGQSAHTAYPHGSPAYRFDVWTTRLALFDRGRMLERLAPLPLSRPPHKRTWVKALVNGNPLVGVPEDILKARVRARGMSRVDLLGSGAGMWSLHPSLKPPEYLSELPQIIARVEQGDLPPEQLGHYDIVDAFVDQSAMRRDRQRRRWR